MIKWIVLYLVSLAGFLYLWSQRARTIYYLPLTFPDSVDLVARAVRIGRGIARTPELGLSAEPDGSLAPLLSDSQLKQLGVRLACRLAYFISRLEVNKQLFGAWEFHPYWTITPDDVRWVARTEAADTLSLRRNCVLDWRGLRVYSCGPRLLLCVCYTQG